MHSLLLVFMCEAENSDQRLIDLTSALARLRVETLGRWLFNIRIALDSVVSSTN